MNKPIIAPSLLSCDFARIQQESEMLNASEADWFHLDVMDGVFVPNISFGLPVIKAFRSHTQKTLDVHLMIVEPNKYVAAFKKAGADVLTVHAEACVHLHRTIQHIKAEGMKAGVALNPHTPLNGLEEVIADLDLVCVMSVNPGFGGQKFIERTYDRVQRLRQMIERESSNAMIEIDGGVTLENASKLLKAGANVLVAGSTVFNSQDPTATIAALKRA